MNRQDRTEQPTRPQNGSRAVESHHAAEIIYDATVRFCERFIVHRSHTAEHMVEAARSCRQIIADFSRAASRQAGHALHSMAAACLEELRLVYEDFLSLRGLPVWGEGHPQVVTIRVLIHRSDWSYGTYRGYVENDSPETAANTLICLIRETNHLLEP